MNWQELQDRHAQLSQHLMQPDLPHQKRAEYQKELSRLSGLLDKHALITSLEKTIQETEQLAVQNSDPEMAELYASELTDLKKQHADIQGALEELLYPPDERDMRPCYIEIRAGAGGGEAALFAADLLRMYTNYALKQGWRVSIVSSSETDLKGFREVILHVESKGSFGHFKHEAGTHRVQRVPATETQGRVHTSTATVVVLPEVDEMEAVTINPADLRIDVYRAGGAGGQHVNTTDSAVRITHIPTGTVVSCQDERSQHKNKAKALKVLQSRILAAEREKYEEEQAKNRKQQVGTGMRAEKVRTYNYPQNRVTDHQVNLTLQKLDMVMQGALDEIIEALRLKDRQERKAKIL
ncbi:MAG: peptide chain release factor 1 [Candidatus Babeliales bacterium]